MSIAEDTVYDQVYEAVEAAINCGVSVRRFKRICFECWIAILDEKKQGALKSWMKEDVEGN